MHFVVTLLFSTFGHLVSYNGVRDRVCGLAMAPAGEPSPRASLGFGKRVIDQPDHLREHPILPNIDFDAP